MDGPLTGFTNTQLITLAKKIGMIDTDIYSIGDNSTATIKNNITEFAKKKNINIQAELDKPDIDVDAGVESLYPKGGKRKRGQRKTQAKKNK